MMYKLVKSLYIYGKMLQINQMPNSFGFINYTNQEPMLYT